MHAHDPAIASAAGRTPSVLYWRRIDHVGIERLVVTVEPDRIVAASTVIGTEGGGYRLDHRWRLTPDWSVQSAEIERWNDAGHAMLRLARAGSGWEVDGVPRADLDGAEEPDLSVTPFCNTFPIRRVPPGPGQSLTLDVAFIDGASLTVERSRQRYERLSTDRLRYVDLGLFKGFEAELIVDAHGLVESYEGLFERVAPAASPRIVNQ